MAKLDTYSSTSYVAEQINRLAFRDNIVHSGGDGDGTTDNAAAFTAAIAASADKSVYLPKGTFYRAGSDAGASLGEVRLYGEGVAKTGVNTRARYFSQITSAPSSLGNHSSIDTTFNGDWSGCQFQIEHRTTGAATLGQPTTSYVYTPECMPFYLSYFNSSGHQQLGGTGRTGTAALRVAIGQYGQGDMVCYNGTALVASTLPGATSFLENPAVVLFNGECIAAAAGTYLNVCEFNMNDGGYDVAGIGVVYNSRRAVDTGALDCVWYSVRSQSLGSAGIDAHISLSGLCKYGIELHGLTFPGAGTYSEKVAITLAPTHKIAFNANTASSSVAGYPTVPGGAYWSYQSSISSLVGEVTEANVLALSNPASSVNWVGIRGNITTGRPRIFADGETDVSLEYVAKGTGIHVFSSGGAASTGAGGAIQVVISNTAGATNWVTLAGSNGGDPLIVVGGATTNVSQIVRGKGTGGVKIQDGGSANKFEVNTTGIGFFAGTPTAKQTVTGSRGGNAALQSLLTALAAYGLITDSSS